MRAPTSHSPIQQSPTWRQQPEPSENPDHWATPRRWGRCAQAPGQPPNRGVFFKAVDLHGPEEKERGGTSCLPEHTKELQWGAKCAGDCLIGSFHRPGSEGCSAALVLFSPRMNAARTSYTSLASIGVVIVGKLYFSADRVLSSFLWLKHVGWV